MTSKPVHSKPHTREELEYQKLKLEVSRLNRQWYSNPEYYPSLIAIGTLVVLLLNGNFSVKQDRLELQKERLAYESQIYSDKIASQKVLIDSLRRTSDSEKVYLMKLINIHVAEKISFDSAWRLNLKKSDKAFSLLHEMVDTLKAKSERDKKPTSKK